MGCINNCRICRDYKCRCDSCFALVEESGEWYCDKYEDYCEGIEICDEFAERDEDVAVAEDDAFERYMDAVKADVAWCLGIEEDSDEWYELMDI